MPITACPRAWRRVAIALAALALAAPVAAQVPDEFTNLKLLPPDISKAELVATMRGWAGALGVRCNHCHVGSENPASLRGMNFASDEKATKRTARRMLEMSRTLNDKLLADLPTAEHRDHQTITCYSCHRGMARPPRALGDELALATQSGGIEAAVKKYRELRAEHFAAGRYDFRDRGLNIVAGQLIEAGRTPEARRLLELNHEFYPDSVDIDVRYGQLFLKEGKLDEAQAAFAKALAAEPDNGAAKFGLSQVERARKEPAR